MKTFTAIGHTFCVDSVLRKLACRGSSNSETVCFKLNRYVGKTDLSECNCTVKTKDSAGNSDLAVPKVTADDKQLNVYWTLSSASTTADGPLLVQLQFEKIFDDKSKNINWQSSIMEFEIADSLDAAVDIEDQDPTIFQQWEEKVNTLYVDAAANVQSMHELINQVQTDADMVTQQKQSVEQTAAQAAQDAQNAAENRQNVERPQTRRKRRHSRRRQARRTLKRRRALRKDISTRRKRIPTPPQSAQGTHKPTLNPRGSRRKRHNRPQRRRSRKWTRSPATARKKSTADFPLR